MTSVGLVGSGKMAESYINALNLFNNEKFVVHHFSSRPKHLEQLLKNQDNPNVSLVTANSLDEVYANGSKVIIATSVFRTDELMPFLADQSRPTLIEKPGFLSVANFEKFFNGYPDNGNLFFAFNRRFYKGIDMLKNYLDRHEENLIAIDFFCSDIINNEYLKSHFRKENLEARLLNTTIHWIDLINYLFKSPGIQRCHADSRSIKLAYDTGALNYNFQVVYNAPVNNRLNVHFTNSKCFSFSPIETLRVFESFKSIVKTKSGYEFTPEVVLRESLRSKPGLKAMLRDFLYCNKDNSELHDHGRLGTLFQMKKVFSDIKQIVDASQ